MNECLGNVYLVEMNCDILIVETPEMCSDFDGQYEFSFVFLIDVSFWQKKCSPFDLK